MPLFFDASYSRHIESELTQELVVTTVAVLVGNCDKLNLMEKRNWRGAWNKGSWVDCHFCFQSQNEAEMSINSITVSKRSHHDTDPMFKLALVTWMTSAYQAKWSVICSSTLISFRYRSLVGFPRDTLVWEWILRQVFFLATSFVL